MNSERPLFIKIKQKLSDHYRKLLKENANEEHWKMPACKQEVKFFNSTSENNEIVLNDDYNTYLRSEYATSDDGIQRNR